jgi:hypothetical protein
MLKALCATGIEREKREIGIKSCGMGDLLGAK